VLFIITITIIINTIQRYIVCYIISYEAE